MSTLTSTGLASPRLEFKSHTLPVAILLFICFWAFFYHTGNIEIDLMEARNLVTAREIRLNDSWLVPTMNGEIRLAKPPLPTWIAALVSKSAEGSENLGLLRKPNAVAALLLILFTYGLAWTLCKDRTLAFMAAALLATNFLTMSVGHRATWDIFCHSFMLGALWAFVDGIRNHRRWPVFALAGLLMGLAFMSKGPVAFFALLLPFATAYIWIFRSDGLPSNWPLIAMAFVLCIVISSLWPLYIYNFHSDALLNIVDVESEAWANRHVQAFYYYLKFPLFSGLWLVLTLAALIKPFAERRVADVRAYRFFLLWLAIEIVLLSAVPEKKTRYLLPAMIPMALLAAMLLKSLVVRFNDGTWQPWDRRLMLIQLGWITVFSIALLGVLFYRLDARQVEIGALFASLWAAAALAVIAAYWYLLRIRHLQGLFLLSLLQFCVLATVYMHYYREVKITNPEYRTMESFDRTRLPGDIEIFMANNNEGPKYAWDLDRPVHRWRLKHVQPILEGGGTIAMISTIDPAREMAELYSEPVDITVIDGFDYDERHPHHQKTSLYLVRAR